MVDACCARSEGGGHATTVGRRKTRTSAGQPACERSRAGNLAPRCAKGALAAHQPKRTPPGGGTDRKAHTRSRRGSPFGSGAGEHLRLVYPICDLDGQRVGGWREEVAAHLSA